MENNKNTKELPKEYLLFGIEDENELSLRKALAIFFKRGDNPLMVSKAETLPYKHVGIKDGKELFFRRALAIFLKKDDNPLMIISSEALAYKEIFRKALENQKIKKSIPSKNEIVFKRFQDIVEELLEEDDKNVSPDS